jgi:nucleoside-diphosphate-sugar epimerase
VTEARSVLITGAAGNLGAKLRRHLEGRYRLRLLDLHPRGDPAVERIDLADWTAELVERFRDVDTVVHLAGNPRPYQTWEQLVRPNLDALVNVFNAGVRAGVRRIVYASSNHVMGGYKDDPEPASLTSATPPRPGTRYLADGQPRDSTGYGAAKLFGERLGKGVAEAFGVSVIAVRIGWVRAGDNRAADIPRERGDWFRLMWLSNRDFCAVMERCIAADPSLRFAVINAMSANTGMRWDLAEARQAVGYEPQDDVTAARGGGEPPGGRIIGSP